MNTEKEAAFFAWYEKIEPYRDSINIRMAFDAGWEAFGREALEAIK